jgi:hypothetical protein
MRNKKLKLNKYYTSTSIALIFLLRVDPRIMLFPLSNNTIEVCLITWFRIIKDASENCFLSDHARRSDKKGKRKDKEEKGPKSPSKQ